MEDAAKDHVPSALELPLNTLGWGDPLGWLAKGWQDFQRAPLIGVFYGGCFAAMGWMLLAMFQHAPAWVLALSELTYAVYLLHNWLFDVFLQAFQRLGLRDVYASLATLALLGAVCWLLVRCVERPGVRWGRTLASRMSSQAPALTPPEQHGRVAASSRTPPPASSRS